MRLNSFYTVLQVWHISHHHQLVAGSSTDNLHNRESQPLIIFLADSDKQQATTRMACDCTVNAFLFL